LERLVEQVVLAAVDVKAAQAALELLDKVLLEAEVRLVARTHRVVEGALGQWLCITPTDQWRVLEL
jgi:hypothetical protein